MKTKSTFHIIPRRKGVGGGSDFFPHSLACGTRIGGGRWGERSRVWPHLPLPSHAQSLSFISKTQQASFKPKYANSPRRAPASILHSLAPVQPTFSWKLEMNYD